MNHLCQLSVVQAAKAIQEGEITSESLVAALLERAREMEPLNAFVACDAKQLASAARVADMQRAGGRALGPLHGVPIALKDNIDTVRLPTTAGTPALRDRYAPRNAVVARSLFDAGALLFGKTGMHELALGVTSNNSAFGPIRNPYDPKMIPGGSSGGAGAAVSAGIVPACIGTDTGGSVRIPAALCGVVGFRPTVKRWAQAGIVPISSTRDTAGPLARSFGDIVLLDSVVVGGQSRPLSAKPLEGIRLGVPGEYFWSDLDSETERLCTAALATLKQAGAILVHADLPRIEALDTAVSFIISLYELRRDLDRFLKEEGLEIRFSDIEQAVASPDVAGLLKTQRDAKTMVSEAAYRLAMERDRPLLIDVYARYVTDHRVDGIVFPTTPLPACPIGQDQTVLLNGRQAPTFKTMVRNTGPGSVAGNPGITIPVGLTNTGLPVGLAVDALPGMDQQLLSIGLSLESIFPPPLAPKDGPRQ